MPSEIARLVYGYLLETKCEKSANFFLDESPCLKEFSEGVRSGKRYLTTINQKSLIQMLNENSLRKIEFENNNRNQTNSSFEAISCINLLKNDILELSNIINKNKYFVNTEVHEALNNQLQQNLVKKTVSPRRKCSTPKRITLQQPESTKFNQCVSSNCDPNFPVSSLSASVISKMQNKTGDYVVNKKLMYEKLLNCKPLQEKLASKINYKMSSELKNKNASPLLKVKDSTQMSETRDFIIGNIEIDLLPSDILNEIIDSILDEPELDELIETVIVKDNQEFQHTDLSASALSLSPNNRIKSFQNDTILDTKRNFYQETRKTKAVEEIAQTQLHLKRNNKGAHLSNYKFQVLRNKQLQLQQMQTKKLASITVGSPVKSNNKTLQSNKSTQLPNHQLKLLSPNSTEISNVINLSCKQQQFSSHNKSILKNPLVNPQIQSIVKSKNQFNQKPVNLFSKSTQIQLPVTSTPIYNGKRKAVENVNKSVKVPAITNLNDNQIKAILNTNMELFLEKIHKSNIESFKK